MPFCAMGANTTGCHYASYYATRSHGDSRNRNQILTLLYITQNKGDFSDC